MNCYQVSFGTLNASLIHPREVFNPAIKVNATEYTRETVSKYMHILKAEGKIRITKEVGKVNLYEASG